MRIEKIDTSYLPGHLHITHPSILETANGCRMMAYRTEDHPKNQRSGTGLCYMTDRWQVKKTVGFIPFMREALPAVRRNHERMLIAEDCRLFEHNDRVFFTLTNRMDIYIGQVEPFRIAMLAYPFHVPHDEKNWMFFEYDQKLYGIRFPHSEIYRIYLDWERGHAVQLRYEHEPMSWGHGRLSGGSCPVRVGDRYVTTIHSWESLGEPKRRYVGGVYTFEAKPPFKVLQRPSKIMLAAKAGAPSFYDEGHEVAFPLGINWSDTDHEFVVSYGDNLDCYLAHVDASELLSYTQP